MSTEISELNKALSVSPQRNRAEPNDLPQLDHELYNSALIKAKCIASDEYATAVYNALCNVQWSKKDVYQILKGEPWTCSWRTAGGIVATIVESGDYMDYYCSMRESEITDEILNDFNSLGWFPELYDPESML